MGESHLHCAVLKRRKRKDQWELQCYTLTPEMAWLVAFTTEWQEHKALKNLEFKNLVVSREDYERGSFKELKAPAGWLPDLPSGFYKAYGEPVPPGCVEGELEVLKSALPLSPPTPVKSAVAPSPATPKPVQLNYSEDYGF